MGPVRAASVTLAALAASALLAACGDRGAGEGVLHRGNTAEPLTLDPHLATGNWEYNIVGDMLVGLYTSDGAGGVTPGMATGHEVSEDGLTWTFHLREAEWSDGAPVTAHDFVYGLRRILSPQTLSQFATRLYIIRNGEAVNTGALPPEELGVHAPDDRTLVIALEHPAPYLAGLTGHFMTYPVPAHVVEEHGDAWIQPRNIVVNGPYILNQWRSNDFVHLVKNENFYDAENVCLNEVYYYPTTDVNAAVRRVRAGELHVNSAFPAQQIDELNQQLPGYVRVHPHLSTTYYVFNTRRAPFDDVRVRRALSMAVDREFITGEILRETAEPTSRLVRPGVEDYPGVDQADWWDMDRDARLAEARTLLEDAGFGPSNPLRFEYTYRNSGSNPRVAPVVQANWQEIAPWVQASIFAVEVQIHYANLQLGDFDVGDAGWVSSAYNTAQDFVSLLETGIGEMNYGRYSNPELDELMRLSRHEADARARGELLAGVERIIVRETPIMPVWHSSSLNLVHPDLEGWTDNPSDMHPTRYLCLPGARAAAEAG